MTKKQDEGDDELRLSRFWGLGLLLFAWFPLPDVSQSFDSRLSTTKAFRAFLRYARGLRFLTSLSFVRVYLGLIFDNVDIGFAALVSRHLPVAPSDVAVISHALFPSASIAGIAWSLFQGWGTATALFAMFYQLAKIADEDTSLRAG